VSINKKGGSYMSIYEELINRVSEGEPFHINFEKRNMKVGNDYLIKDGEFDESKELISPIFKNDCLEDILRMILQRYRSYKISLPSERSDNKRRHYFKALSMEEITDEQLMVAERREVACAALEGFVLCMIVSGQLVWDEEIMEGKWFYQSKNDPDLVLLRSWVEGK
jgi:hypothetical protein